MSQFRDDIEIKKMIVVSCLRELMCENEAMPWREWESSSTFLPSMQLVCVSRLWSPHFNQLYTSIWCFLYVQTSLLCPLAVYVCMLSTFTCLLCFISAQFVLLWLFPYLETLSIWSLLNIRVDITYKLFLILGGKFWLVPSFYSLISWCDHYNKVLLVLIQYCLSCSGVVLQRKR